MGITGKHTQRLCYDKINCKTVFLAQFWIVKPVGLLQDYVTTTQMVLLSCRSLVPCSHVTVVSQGDDTADKEAHSEEQMSHAKRKLLKY